VFVTPDDPAHRPEPEPASAKASSSRFTISTRMSYLLIGGMALGGIVLMCLTVLMLVLLQQD